jgi:predicted PurR-regulated permease PerM
MPSAQAGFRFAAIALSIAALAVFVPLWAPLVLAAWSADLMRPCVRRLVHALGGRRAAAGLLSVLVVVAIGAPLVMIALVFAERAYALLITALRAGSARGAMSDLLGSGEPADLSAVDPRAVLQLIREHAGTLGHILGGVASVSTNAALGAVVFIVALYALNVDGRRVYAWLARSVPLDANTRLRLLGAFRETGRGLLVGAGGTALAQGMVATVAYAALGVRNPITLGVLTGVGSFIPAVGTAIVWAPVAAALGLAGHPGRAGILVLVGLSVIATIDNFLRPWLARVGRLHMPVALVFLSMVGGLQLVGGWGLILGPLLVRMAMEVRSIGRDRGLRESAGRDRKIEA